MGEDLIEAKIGAWGFSLNLKEVWRRLRGHNHVSRKSEENSVTVVAQRFR